MGTTAQKLQAIANSKAAIKAAIEAKGVSDVGDVLSQYATKIGQISGGGSSGDPRYEVDGQGTLVKKNFALNYFNDAIGIPYRCFEYAYYNSKVTSASFPNLTNVDNYGMSHAFHKCASLTTISFPNLTTIRPNGLECAFQDCTSLTSVDLSSVTRLENSGLNGSFNGCTSLTSIDLSGITTVTGSSALRTLCLKCNSLTSVDLSNLQSASGTQALSQAFDDCTSLTTISFPNLTFIGYYGFQYICEDCTSLKTVYLTKLSSVGSNGLNESFSGCTSLELVDFSQATAVPSLSNVNAFKNTNDTFKVVVPDALYDQWIAATNWSTYASHIVKASEYTPAT